MVVTGAGPIGLLAADLASMGETEVHVLDRLETGLRPDLVRALGATYHSGSLLDLDFEPNIIVECTGAGPPIAAATQKMGAGGIICLTGKGRPMVLWALLKDATERRRLFRSGLKDFGKVFIVACVLDTTYQTPFS
jgi:threonine dehydrogenase-like Zn-dependent dehydrogenase